MKKIFVILFTFLAFNIFAFSRKAPNWLKNLDSVYPEKTFLRQIGSSKNSDSAKAAAATALSQYLKTNIKNSIETVNFDTTDQETKPFSSMLENTILESELTISGLNYTEIYYEKKEKTYYCAAFIEKKAAWKQFAQNIEAEKRNFYSFYEKAENQDPINQYFWFEKSTVPANAFMTNLSILFTIDALKASEAYGKEMQVISSLEAKKTEALKDSTIFIEVDLDNGGTIKNDLQKILKDFGLTVVSNKKSAKYLGFGKVNLNAEKEGSDDDVIFYAFPEFEFNLEYDGNSIFTFNTKCDKKIVNATEQRLKQNSIKNLSEKIRSEMKISFSE